MNKYHTTKGVFEGDYYNIFWGFLHREDGPAVMYANGNKEWWVNGEIHRLDGPAIERKDGSNEWWVNDKRHRTDGPAIEWSSGTKKWYQNGLFHRLDGPAIEYANGDKVWYQNGLLHRLDGPTVMYANGTKVWYINNESCAICNYYKQKEVIEHLELHSILISSDAKNLIQEYKNTTSNDIFQVIQDYFLENNLLTNSTYSDILLDVIMYYNFK